MKISLTYLLTELAKFKPDHRINSDAYFDQIRLLDLGSLDLKPNTLYVTNVRDFGIVNNRIKNCTLIVCDHLGLMEKVDVSQDMNLIVVKDRISTERLMNHLIGVFDAFQTTANDLLAMTLEHKEYFVLYDRLTKLMDIPLVVLNDDFGILGTTSGAPREVGENLKHLLRLESEDLHNEKVVEMDAEKGLYAKINRVNMEIVYELVCFPTGFAGKEEYFSLLRLLSPALSELLSSGEDREELVRDLVTKLLYPSGDENLVLSRLEQLHWGMDNKYRIYYTEEKEALTPRLRTEFSKVTRYNTILEIGTSTVLVVNLSHGKADETRLERVVHRGDTRFVESNPLRGLKNFRAVYNTCRNVYHASIQNDMITMKSGYYDLVYEKLKESVNIRTLLHPFVLALYQQDIDDRSDNLETLYIYLLHERSYLKASKLMNLHRNSIVYRVGRVQEMFPMDLDDETVRNYIIFSYEMLKRMEKDGSLRGALAGAK